MRRITVLALVAVIALLGAACGGDDDDSGGEDTEATDDGTTTDDGGDESDDGGDDGGEGGDLAAAIAGMGGCSGAAAAVSASMFAGLNPEAAEQLEENRAFFDDFESSVPDDIKDDVALFAEYVEAYSEVLGDYDANDFRDPDKAAEMSEAFEDLEDDYPSDDMQAASDRISDWFTEECPGLAGS